MYSINIDTSKNLNSASIIEFNVEPSIIAVTYSLLTLQASKLECLSLSCRLVGSLIFESKVEVKDIQSAYGLSITNSCKNASDKHSSLLSQSDNCY